MQASVVQTLHASQPAPALTNSNAANLKTSPRFASSHALNYTNTNPRSHAPQAAIVLARLDSTALPQLIHRGFNLFQPLLALLELADDHRAKNEALHVADAAEAKHDPAPKDFQRIAQERDFFFLGGVGGGNDAGGPGFKQAHGFGAALAIFDEIIGQARTQDAIDPALQDGGRLAPPVGMNNDNAVGGADFIAVPLDGGRQGGVLGNFGRRYDGIEWLGIKIVEPYLMAKMMESIPGRLGDGVIKATRGGVRQNERNVQFHCKPRGVVC